MCHTCNYWYQCWSLAWISSNQLLNHGVHYHEPGCRLTEHNKPPVTWIWRRKLVYNLVFVIPNEQYQGSLVEILRAATHNIFHCGATPLNVNFTDFGNKTSWDPRHIIYQSDEVKQTNYDTLVSYCLYFAHFVSIF